MKRSNSSGSNAWARSLASALGLDADLAETIALAHDLGMDVVAEGAETDSDAVELYQLGCEYAQGFAFGEPMDADAAMRLLTEERLEAAS